MPQPPLGGLIAVLSTAIAMILAGGPAALAATTSTSLHDVLSQLRRNSKVSERLNAAFFRAPQTQGYSGSALKPTDIRDYKVGFTPTEWAQLQSIFPNGVCDYSQPGIGQQPLLGTYLLVQ